LRREAMNKKTNTIRQIADTIKGLKSAVIFTHVRPDGDTVGCAVALSRALSFLGIKNEMLNEGEIPERYGYLSGKDEFKRRPSFDAEAYILVDCSDETRLGGLSKFYQAGAGKHVTINIDHHIANTYFAQHNFVRERASNCENVAELIRTLGVKYDEDIANALMTGFVTDSGGFSHGDVDGDTFRAAALAMDGGADVALITYETMRRRSQAQTRFYLSVVSAVRYLLDGKLGVASVSQAQLEEYGLKPDATEGLVDFALTVDGVEVSVCLLEMKRGQYKASFRSRSVDVNDVAAVFGGGGHVLASGCMLFGDLEEVVDRVRYAVYQRL